MRNAFVLVFLCIRLASGFIVPSGGLELLDEDQAILRDYDGNDSEETKKGTLQGEAADGYIVLPYETNDENNFDLRANQNRIKEKELYEQVSSKQNTVNERSFIFINQKFKTPVVNQLRSSQNVMREPYESVLMDLGNQIKSNPTKYSSSYLNPNKNSTKYLKPNEDYAGYLKSDKDNKMSLKLNDDFQGYIGQNKASKGYPKPNKVTPEYSKNNKGSIAPSKLNKDTAEYPKSKKEYIAKIKSTEADKRLFFPSESPIIKEVVQKLTLLHDNNHRDSHDHSIHENRNDYKNPTNRNDYNVPKNKNDYIIPETKQAFRIPDNKHDHSAPENEQNYKIAENKHEYNIPDNKHDSRIPEHKHDYSTYEEVRKADDQREYVELLKMPILRPEISSDIKESELQWKHPDSPFNNYQNTKKMSVNGPQLALTYYDNYGFPSPYGYQRSIPQISYKPEEPGIATDNNLRKFMNDKTNIEVSKYLDQLLRDSSEELETDKIMKTNNECGHSDCVLKSREQEYKSSIVSSKPECKCSRKLNVKQRDSNGFQVTETIHKEVLSSTETYVNARSSEINDYSDMFPEEMHLKNLIED